MDEQQAKTLEPIQRVVARLLATSPAGRNLCLIGGFRYRFLDCSSRMSRDLSEQADYHGRAVAAVISEQLDPAAAANIQAAGGAALVLRTVLDLLSKVLKLGGVPT